MPFKVKGLFCRALLLLCGGMIGISAVPAQDGQLSEPRAASVSTPLEASLANEQARVAQRFEELQQALLKMAEVTASTDPRRAAVLRQAYTRSTELALEQKFDGLVELLGKDQLYQATQDQTQLQQDLARLLELLLSGEGEKLPDEKARMAEILKQVNRLIKDQKGLQGQTSGEADPKELAQRQAEVASRTAKLRENIEKTDEENAAKSNPSDKPSQNKSTKPGENRHEPDAPAGSEQEGGESERDNGEKRAGEQSSNDQKQPPSEGGESNSQEGSRGAPKSGTPMDGQGQESGDQAGEESQESDAQQTPGRKRIAAAEKRMKAAEEQLKKAVKDKAVEEQQKALEELEMAKAELEKILRQLREEEIDRMLTMLEARFRKMLAMQTEVYEGTQRLSKISASNRTREDEIEAGRLGRRESEIVAEADKALLLMKEDGSAVAFPEAVVQIRTDMQQVSDLLSRADVSELTVALEEDILSSIEEMLEALRQAKQKQQEQQAQPMQMPAGEPVEPPLVDQLSELRMIRTLQVRVNNRTVQYSKMLEGAGADRAQIRKGLDELAERQSRIHGVTRDIVTGKNQ